VAARHCHVRWARAVLMGFSRGKKFGFGEQTVSPLHLTPDQIEFLINASLAGFCARGNGGSATCSPGRSTVGHYHCQHHCCLPALSRIDYLLQGTTANKRGGGRGVGARKPVVGGRTGPSGRSQLPPTEITAWVMPPTFPSFSGRESVRRPRPGGVICPSKRRSTTSTS
jgi:hypothetical protein